MQFAILFDTHGRGEHESELTYFDFDDGSSPLAWGTLTHDILQIQQSLFNFRIIPGDFNH
jgi:hypothetical protein